MLFISNIKYGSTIIYNFKNILIFVTCNDKNIQIKNYKFSWIDSNHVEICVGKLKNKQWKVAYDSQPTADVFPLDVQS